MRLTRWTASIVFLATATALAAGNGYKLFQQGLAKERAEGDPRGAIQIYEQVVKESVTDRKLGAQALLRIGECYGALGDAQATKAYERVLREYADQKEAVTEARARLDALRPRPAFAGIVNSKVWELPRGGDIFGSASPEGRYIAYVDWDEGGDLFLHDLLTATNRKLTNTANPGVKPAEEQYAEEYSFSRDGKLLAYSWYRGNSDRYELRVLPLNGSAAPAFRTLLNDAEISWMVPHDWTPDGKWIAVQLNRKDKSAQIGVVSSANGELRVLKSIDWRGTNGMFFSADGKYLAYDLPAGDSEQQRDIYLLSVDGSHEVPLVVHPSEDALLGWSPDGKQLLFASDRSGSMGLWSQHVADGRPQGSPELLKADIGELQNMGISSSGVLHYATWPSMGGDIQTATFDFDKGVFSSPPVQAVSTYLGSNRTPDWSPDGRYLAFSSRRRSVGLHYFVVGIRATESGHVREVVPVPNFTILWPMSWSRDGKSLIVGGADSKGRTGVFRLDAQTGRTSMIFESKDRPRVAAESPDGKFIYYRSETSDDEGPAYYKRDLNSGEETILLRTPTGSGGGGALSPDGRYLAVNDAQVVTKSRGIFLVPTFGGEVREVIQVTTPQLIFFFSWAPDGRSLLARKRVDDKTEEMWKVPLDGSEPTKLQAKLVPGAMPERLEVHPDGRQVAFQVPVPRKPAEIWALENFLTAGK